MKPKPTPDLGNGIDIGSSDLDVLEGDQQGFGSFGSKKPGSGSTTSRPGHTRPTAKPIPSFDEDDGDDDDIVDDLFGGSGGSSSKKPSFRPTTPRPSSTGRPTITTFKPTLPAEEEDDGSYKPGGSDDGSYKPTLDESSIGSSTSSRPGKFSTNYP